MQRSVLHPKPTSTAGAQTPVLTHNGHIMPQHSALVASMQAVVVMQHGMAVFCMHAQLHCCLHDNILHIVGNPGWCRPSCYGFYMLACVCWMSDVVCVLACTCWMPKVSYPLSITFLR